MSPYRVNRTLSAGVTPAASGATPGPQRTSSLAVVTLVVLTLLLPLAGCSAVGAQRGPSPGPAQQVTPSATVLTRPSAVGTQIRGASTAPAQQVTPSAAPTTGPSVHEVAQTTMLTRATLVTASATCPQGEFALGGGWDVPTQARVFAAQLNGNTWTVSVGGYKGSITVTASVECLRGVGRATVTQRAFPFPAEPDTLANPFDLCNSGETLVGGGFDLGTASPTLELQETTPTVYYHQEWWGLRVMNHDTVEHMITLYLECLSNVQRTPNCINLGLPSCQVTVQGEYPAQEGVDVYSGEPGTVMVSCPSGTVVAGGGLYYQSGADIVGSLYLLQAAPGGWQGAATPVTSNGLFALVSNVTAVCLSFS
jgi:hypothetical protein